MNDINRMQRHLEWQLKRINRVSTVAHLALGGWIGWAITKIIPLLVGE